MARIYRKLPPLTPQDVQRFWTNVDISTPQGPQGTCWEWTAARIGKRGRYGWCKLGDEPYYANRIAYQIYYGNLREDRQVCHACDNPPCVNPLHLWMGTQEDNSRDFFDKGRPRNHPAKGATHHLTHLRDDDINIIRSKQVWRRGDVKLLATRYGIDRHTLLAIRRRKTWKHL